MSHAFQENPWKSPVSLSLLSLFLCFSPIPVIAEEPGFTPNSRLKDFVHSLYYKDFRAGETSSATDPIYSQVRHLIGKAAFNALPQRLRLALVDQVTQKVTFDSPHPVFCFAPGTSIEVIQAFAQARKADKYREMFPEYPRWGTTATNGSGLDQGDPTTITYSFVPDGTSISGESSKSNLIAFLNSTFGNEATWKALFATIFNEWSAVAGVTYVYEPDDDGVLLPNYPGSLGVRGDVRISGVLMDGTYGVLAYNYNPDWSDMVIDTGDGTFFGNSSNNYLNFRNTIAHEHGHGLGAGHVCPINQSKLMEPYLTTLFDGPRHDDTLFAQRYYGDPNEVEGGNTYSDAHGLGTLGDQTVSITQVSLDGTSDQDWYSFTVPGDKRVDFTVSPFGTIYLEGAQNEDWSCSPGTNFNSTSLSNLAIAIISSNGSAVLGSADLTAAGGSESLTDFALNSAGTFYLKVYPGTSAVDEVQMYNLSLTVEPAAGAPTPTVTNTPTITNTPAPTSTRTSTRTSTGTRTRTPTRTGTSTGTATRTRTSTTTRTVTSTGTATKTNSATPSRTGTSTPTLSKTPTNTPVPPTATHSSTSTATPTPSPSRTATVTTTRTYTSTGTSTPAPTDTPTNTPVSPTATHSPSSTATSTVSVTHTNTPVPTATYSPTLTGTATQTNTPVPPTVTATHTATSSPSATPSSTRTGSSTPTSTPPPPTSTPTSTSTQTQSATVTHTGTATASATPSQTKSPTQTGTPTISKTPTMTRTFTRTRTPTRTWTSTHTRTGTRTPTITRTPTLTRTGTATHTGTRTATPSATVTVTPSPSQTATWTLSPTSTGTQTFTHTATPTSSPAPTSTPTNPAERELPAYFCLAAPATVTITLNLESPLPPIILLEEQIPAGWIPTDISNGGELFEGMISWSFVEGFGNYPPPAQVTYKLTAQTSEDAVFTGTIAIPDVFQIGGETSTEEECPCYAGDTNCDLRLTIGEAATLLNCWRAGGCEIGEAAQGLTLWLGGECYEQIGENQFENVPCNAKSSQTHRAPRMEKDGPSSAIRTIPDCYTTGQAFEVMIALSLSSPLPQVVLMEDQVPDGWAVSNISNNGILSAGKVRWSFIEGLGNYPPPTQVSYTVMPQANGTVQFSGTLAVPEESQITGEGSIEECLLAVEFWSEY